MAVAWMEKQDNRIHISWHKPLSTKYLDVFYTKAHTALKNSPYRLQRMNARIRASKTPKQTLNIILDYIDFG